MDLIAYKINNIDQKIVSGQIKRDWMDESNDRFAYRCLPMTIANQSGWDILCPCDVLVKWNGGNKINDVFVLGHHPTFAVAHFGFGVVTFHPSYLFKTPDGYNLKVEGTPNLPKDGIYPLSGVVETDWLAATFTMNWKFTRPGEVLFKKDEPFCRISLTPRILQEEASPQIIPIENNESLCKDYNDWRLSRSKFLENLPKIGTEENKKKWQKDYMLGIGATNHQTKLKLKEFI